MAGNSEADDIGFVRPGILTVAPAALDLAKKVAATVGSAWVVTFSWADKQSIRAGRDAPEIDIGPGLGLGGFRRDEVPDGYVQSESGVSFAIQIPRDVLEKCVNRRIDIDPQAFGRLKLS